MKEKKTVLQQIKKILIILFCAITVIMNMINYMKGSGTRELGTVYQWAEDINSIEISDKDYSLPKTNPDDPVDYEALESININTADSEELQTISGIGPSKAAAIIDYREKYGGFVAPEEIMEVPGIGEGIYTKIKDRICIE